MSEVVNDFNAIAQIASRILPIVNHVPDSLGKWVPPLKNIAKAMEKHAAILGLASSGARVLQGRLGVVGAVVSALNARTLGASKGFSAMAGAGALAASKIIHGMHGSGQAARKMAGETASATQRLREMSAHAARISKAHAAGGKTGGGIVSSGLGKLVGIAAAVKGLANVESGFTGALELGAKIAELSSKTGIAADQMLVLQSAAKSKGIEDAATGVNKLQENLVAAVKDGAGPAAKALGMLGLQADQLAKLTPVSQLQAIGAAMRNIKSPEIRASTARDLFGRSGTDMLPLLDDNKALDTAQRSIGVQASLLAVNAAQFQVVSDRLSRSGNKLQGFFVGVASSTLPLIAAATAKLDALDLAKTGQRFGDGIKTGVDYMAGAFANPQALFGASIQYALGAAKSVGNLYINVVGAEFRFIASMFQGMKAPALAVGQALGASFMAAVDKAHAGLLRTALDGQAALSAGMRVAASYLGTGVDYVMHHFSVAWVAAILNPLGALWDGLAIIGARFAGVMAAALRANVPGAISEATKAKDEVSGVLAGVAANLQKGWKAGSPFDFSKEYAADRAGLNGSDVGKKAAALDKDSSLQVAAAGAAIAAALKGSADVLKSSWAALLATKFTEDRLGAAGNFAAGGKDLAAVKTAGAAAVDPFTAPGTGPAADKDPWAAFRGFSAFTSGSGLQTGHLASASLAGGSTLRSMGARAPFLALGGALASLSPALGAPFLGTAGLAAPFDFSKAADMSKPYNRTSVLSAAERNAFADSFVAAGGQRTGSTPSAYHVVHSGDAARQKEIERKTAREKLQGKSGVEETNSILRETLDFNKQTWGAPGS